MFLPVGLPFLGRPWCSGFRSWSTNEDSVVWCGDSCPRNRTRCHDLSRWRFLSFAVTWRIYYHGCPCRVCSQTSRRDINTAALSLRYESETRENILVTNQSSTYVEFRLKRKGASDQNKQESPSKIGTIYNQTKEFVLHRTVVLVVAGVSGLLSNHHHGNQSRIFFCLAVILSVIFASVVLFLRCRHYSISRSLTGFKRYEELRTDPDGSPLISRVSERQAIPNSHAIESASDSGDETLFVSKLNRPLLSWASITLFLNDLKVFRFCSLSFSALLTHFFPVFQLLFLFY